MRCTKVVLVLAILLAGCAKKPAADPVAELVPLPKTPAPASAPVAVEWDAVDPEDTTRTFKSGGWALSYHNRAKLNFQFGGLYYRGVYLSPGNERIGDFIDTPWGRLYWRGVYRHVGGTQGWNPRPAEQAGSRTWPGLVAARNMTRYPNPLKREEIHEQLPLVVEGLVPERRVEFASGYEEMKALEACLKAMPELAAGKEESAAALRVAGRPEGSPVLAWDGKWIVIFDQGHPAADGVFFVTVIDAKARKVLANVGTDGGRQMRE